MEIIPSVDLMGGRVVRLVRGDPRRVLVYSADPLTMSEQWVSQGANRLHVVDIDAALGRGTNHEVTKILAKLSRVPVQVGGGIRSFSQAADLLEGGVERVILGTMAFKDEDSVVRLLQNYGEDKISIALDHSAGKVMVEGWTSNTDVTVEAALRSFMKLGFRRFLLTAISKDGTLTGPALRVLSTACRVEGARIVASGGVRNLADLEKVKKVGAEAVVVGRALYEGKIDLKEAVTRLGESKVAPR